MQDLFNEKIIHYGILTRDIVNIYFHTMHAYVKHIILTGNIPDNSSFTRNLSNIYVQGYLYK